MEGPQSFLRVIENSFFCSITHVTPLHESTHNARQPCSSIIQQNKVRKKNKFRTYLVISTDFIKQYLLYKVMKIKILEFE